MAWLSADPSHAHMERIVLVYSPVWMLTVAAVVFFGFYDLLSAEGYMLLGFVCAAPCVLLPLLFTAREERSIPILQRYSFRVNAWVFIVGFVGNHFITHYFYNVLHMRYTVPVGPWSLNGVPLVMFLLTHPYFLSYHILATVLMRRLGILDAQTSQAVRSSFVLALAYVTAFMETWSISAFPHYTYPDAHLMFTVGSAFYALYFIVTYHLFPLIDTPPIRTPAVAAPITTTTSTTTIPTDNLTTATLPLSSAAQESSSSSTLSSPAGKSPTSPSLSSSSHASAPLHHWTLARTCEQALAASMLVMLLMDAWRLGIGALGGGAAQGLPSGGAQ